MWFQAIYPFKVRQILNQNLSLVVAKVLYTFSLDIKTGKQPDNPHQVTNKPADDIKKASKTDQWHWAQRNSRYLIYGHHCFLTQKGEAHLCEHYKKRRKKQL